MEHWFPFASLGVGGALAAVLLLKTIPDMLARHRDVVGLILEEWAKDRDLIRESMKPKEDEP